MYCTPWSYVLVQYLYVCTVQLILTNTVPMSLFMYVRLHAGKTVACTYIRNMLQSTSVTQKNLALQKVNQSIKKRTMSKVGVAVYV